ncbi:MAG: iron-sulfur cluster repair di-iron protein [Candidatus Kapaibacterium sp.]
MVLTSTLKTKSLARIVADDFRAAEVFERYNLDFCCKGKRPLDVACREKGIDLSGIMTELSSLPEEPGNHQRYADWSSEFLADYIVQQHHSYVRTMIPMIEMHLQKVVRAHGAKHPEVIEIQSLFQKMSGELLGHIMHEETTVFPLIKKLTLLQELSADDLLLRQELVGAIDMLDEDHRAAGDTLAVIQTLTNSFTPPPGACTTFRVLYQELKAFQEDMFRHIHLENNILFPKVLPTGISNSPQKNDLQFQLIH